MLLDVHKENDVLMMPTPESISRTEKERFHYRSKAIVLNVKATYASR
jgi:hypothetical protein